MNPLNNTTIHPMNNNNPAQAMMQFLNRGGDPRQLANDILQKNPQIKQVMEQMHNVTGGQHPKEIAMQLAKQRGIDPSQIMQIAKKMGLK